MKLVLAGFGNVGRAVSLQLADDHLSVSGFQITGGVDPWFGAAADLSRVDQRAPLDTAGRTGRFDTIDGFHDFVDALQTNVASVTELLFERAFTSLAIGKPDTPCIRHALDAGKGVAGAVWAMTGPNVTALFGVDDTGLG